MIRRLVVLAALLLAPVAARSQTDTSTTSFDVNGLKVILRQNTSNDVVAANVYLLGGTQQLSPATQGIESLLLRASEGGTEHFPRGAARQLMARLGGNVVIDASADWTLFGFTGVRQTFDSSWAVFADRLISPTLDSAEVERVRARMMTDVREEANNPDPLVNRLADSLSYVGHPYGFSPDGTETSLFSITLAQLKHYQATQMVTSRMLLVVVGNIDRPHLEQLVGEHAGSPAARIVHLVASASAGERGSRARRPPGAAGNQLPARLLRRPDGARARLPSASHRDRGAVRSLLYGNPIAAEPIV